MTAAIHVHQTQGFHGILRYNHMEFKCTLGEKGLTGDKREGDMKTPLGCFPLKECWYRKDRMEAPNSSLPLITIAPDDGWCDDPQHASYNQPVKLPFTASHEELFRDDEKYDLIVTLGYNDNPFKPGKGSAIFLHVAPEDYPATQGCVGLHKKDLLELLAAIQPGTLLCVETNLPEA
jgi:L,D-peptidoglycan transpeptidase YkuD (ErfK/YbiS/YcfS/YnhG family)